MIKIEEIIINIRSYISKKNNVPASIKVNNNKYNYGQLNYILLDYILNNKTTIANTKINNAPSPTGDKINETISKKQYEPMLKTLYKWIKKNKRNPNYYQLGKTKISPLVLLDVLSRIAEFKLKNKRLPNTVKINSNIVKKNTANPIQSDDSVFKYFVKVFGNVTTIDGAFSKVKDKGYGYYFDDYLSNKQTIDNLKNNGGQKPNCTDTCQVFYHIANALGYEVQIIHVKCQGSGDGHVRMKLKHKIHTGGDWINRDPACIVSSNGRPLTDIWCGNGTVLAVNPSWFMMNVNR